jgi:hypothetical protein
MRMRRAIMMFVGLLLLVPELPAKTSADWSSVENLKWEAPVHMELRNGQEFSGRFDSADDRTLRIKVRDATQNGLSVLKEFPRAQVRIVEQLAGPRKDPYPYLRGGQVIGGVGGAIAGGVATGRAWPVGALFGGLGGLAAGTLVGGTVGVVAMGGNRHPKIVYESQERPPVARPPVKVQPSAVF